MDIPHVAFGWLDYAMMGLYLLVLAGIGLHYRKKAQKDLESYFLADRNLPGWLNGTSYASTCMNSDVAPAYCGMTVITGAWICWWYLSRFGLAMMIGALLFAVAWRRLRIFTSPEFYEIRYGGAPAVTMRSWVAFRSAFIAIVAWTGAGLLGLSKVCGGTLGWPPWFTYLLALPIILFYLFKAGYAGVVASDLFQAAIIILSAFVLMGRVLVDFGGPAGLHDALVQKFGEGVVAWHPPLQHELLGLLGVIAWTLGTAIGYGGDTAPMAGAMEGQRVLSCRNGREAAKMYVWTLVVLFVMLVTLTLPALGAMVKWPGLRDGTINKELSYGMLLAQYMPGGLLGFAMIALFAALMSTVSSNLNFGAQVALNDLYRRFVRPGASVSHYLWVGKAVMVLILGLALVVAYKAKNVIDIAVFMLGLSSAELTANWAQWWWWRFNGPARLAASFGGPLIFVINKFVVFQRLQAASILDPRGDYTYLIIMTSIAATTALWVAVALLTRPDSEANLVAFYRRARPMGWWGPIAAQAGGGTALSGAAPIVKGLGSAVAGWAMLASAIISFSMAYVGRWGAALAGAALALAAGAVFKRAFDRLMRQTLADEGSADEPAGG